jgi:hypothetical protein
MPCLHPGPLTILYSDRLIHLSLCYIYHKALVSPLWHTTLAGHGTATQKKNKKINIWVLSTTHFYSLLPSCSLVMSKSRSFLDLFAVHLWMHFRRAAANARAAIEAI